MKFNEYFNSSEFDSPDLIGSGKNMKSYFIDMLTGARVLFNKPMNINSGFRTEKHNKDVNGKDNSAHLRGYAADIKINNSIERFELVKALIEVGFNRIGIANTFIHCDCDPNLPQKVIWKY